jgi:hypothetical protein
MIFERWSIGWHGLGERLISWIFLIKLSQPVPVFSSCRLAATSREREKLPETANFDRPRTFHSRVLTQGVIPSLHVSYKSTKIKQYFKEERALRTETTINNTHDFGVGRLRKNLPALRAIGFVANRRLLQVETISQDCTLAEGVLDQVTKPQVVADQRVAALRFDDVRVMTLMQVLCLFLVLPQGFRNATMRQWMAQALDLSAEHYSGGRMTYDLRRLRLHGLIARIPHTHRYRVTDLGVRVALFFSKVHSRILRPGLSQLFDGCPKPKPPIGQSLPPCATWIGHWGLCSMRPSSHHAKLDSSVKMRVGQGILAESARRRSLFARPAQKALPHGHPRRDRAQYLGQCQQGARLAHLRRLRPGAFYIMDRGYLDFGRLYRLGLAVAVLDGDEFLAAVRGDTNDQQQAQPIIQAYVGEDPVGIGTQEIGQLRLHRLSNQPPRPRAQRRMQRVGDLGLWIGNDAHPRLGHGVSTSADCNLGRDQSPGYAISRKRSDPRVDSFPRA